MKLGSVQLDEDNVNVPNCNGETTVHRVAEYEDTEGLEKLINLPHADLFKRTDTNNNVYHYSAHITCLAFLDILFSLKTSQEHLFCVNALDQTPLFLAIELDNEVFFEFYLKLYKQASLKSLDANQNNILHCMAKHNAVKCYEKCKLLLSQDELSNLSSARNIDCQTPSKLAKDSNNQLIYECLMGYVSKQTPSLQWIASFTKVTSTLQNLTLGNPQETLEQMQSELPFLGTMLRDSLDKHDKQKHSEQYALITCDQQERDDLDWKCSRN